MLIFNILAGEKTLIEISGDSNNFRFRLRFYSEDETLTSIREHFPLMRFKFKTVYMKYLISFLCASLIFAACSEDKAPGTQVTVKDEKDTALAALGLDSIQLPAGFHLSIFAKVPNARSLAWGSNGTLFVGNRDQDKV